MTGRQVKKSLTFFRRNHFWAVLCLISSNAASGCAPVLNVYGVYFPQWIVVAAIGLALSYAAVRILVRFDWSRPLGQSGIFFLSLAIIFSYICWWALFRM